MSSSTLSCFLQAEDDIRYLVRSRGLGDVYKRQRLRARRAAKGERQRLGGQAAQRVEEAAARPAQQLSLIHT